MGKKSRKKSKTRLVLKIIIGFVIFLFLATGALFTVGYFYYGKIIRSYFTEFVKKESKGVYHADVGYLYINILTGNLTIRNLTLTPDTSLYRKLSASDTLPPLLFRIRIHYFRVSDFNVMNVIRNKKIDISGIHINTSEITLYRMREETKHPPKEKKKEKILSIPLPKGMNSIAIHEILFREGKFDFYDLSGESVIHQSIPSCSISIKNILIDTLHKDDGRIFNADDISIVLKGFSIRTKNKLNVVSLGEVGLSTGAQACYIKDFHLVPQYNRHDYTRKFGYQTDRLDILVPMLRVERLDLKKLITEGKFIAGLLTIDGLTVDDYRDKRIPRKPGFRPAMPQTGIRNLKTYLKIDSVILKNGKATYSEQVESEPGTIYFNKMEAMVTGLTNDKELLKSGLVTELNGSALLMGKGKVKIKVKFLLADLQNRFSFSASVGPMDLREVNPMLSKLLPAEITSGTNRSINVPLVNANDDEARGTLTFLYNNLSVKVNSKEISTWNSIKTGLINFVANDFVVPDENPSKSGKLRTGVIYFSRDKEKGIINFLWKSVLSGLKSQMGFNSDKQKKMKKEKKKK
jgi:hypothetical protein